MTDAIADRLPPDLRAALQAELDPGETLRWCDRPLGARMFRRAVGQSLIGAGVLTVIAAMILFASYKTLREGWSSPATDRPEFFPTAPLLGVALAVAGFLAALASLSGPWFARARAARTVYALTNTRVMTFIKKRSGAIDALAIEPGHPLAIGRKEYGDGSGDIVLYPAPEGRLGRFLLAATPDPRAVERLIRTTFDPPTRDR